LQKTVCGSSRRRTRIGLRDHGGLIRRDPVKSAKPGQLTDTPKRQIHLSKRICAIAMGPAWLDTHIDHFSLLPKPASLHQFASRL
jgi:hypothetical protein